MTPAILPTRLDLVRGDADDLSVAAVFQGVPVDLSSVSLMWWTVKYRHGDPDSAAVMMKTRLTGGIIVTDAVNGLATVHIEGSDWAGYTGIGQLVWDLQIVSPASPLPKPITLAQGPLVVLQDVTRASS